MVFRIAGLAAIRRIPVELDIVFVPFWESRIVNHFKLPGVDRTLRARLLSRSIGFPFEEGTKETSTGLLDFERFKTEIKGSKGRKTALLFFGIIAHVLSVFNGEPLSEGHKEGLSAPFIPLVKMPDYARRYVISLYPFLGGSITLK